MHIDLIRRTVEEGVKHGLREIIPSTMGEPLLYQDFERIVALCGTHGVKLNLTTNGTFPRLGAAGWAELIVPVASDVKISLNGATKATQESIMRGSRWERLIPDLRTFIGIRDETAAFGGNRCQVTFQLTFLEANAQEISDIIRMAVRMGVDRVKGHHLWVHFDALKDQSMRRSPESMRRWNHVVEKAHAAAAERLLPNGHHIQLVNFFPLNESAIGDLAPGGPCPFLGREAWINAEGRFDPCCAPDAQRKRLGSFGSLNGGGVLEIWLGEKYRELMRTYRTRALCLGCNMRKPAEVTL